jgi:penicillin-binding protein 2
MAISQQFNLGDRFQETRVFLNRIVVSVLFMVIAILGLTARLVYLQVVGHDLYTNLSRDNQVKVSPLVPARGMIFDRNGEVLADNVMTYSLEVVPEEVPDMRAALDGLRALLQLTDEEINRFQAERSQRKSFESVPLRLELSEEEIARFALKMPYFPGVEVHKRLIRNYPYSSLTAHVVGYVARINEAELQTLDPAQYRGTVHMGKSGIERSYEPVLHGKTGYAEHETNVKGRVLRDLGVTDPIPGADLYLSLDIRLQKIALDALGEFSGAVVAIEPASGKVLTLASKPSFDPNPFIQGIAQRDYDALNKDPERPLYDRAIRGIYPPGSTVKPFVALAGLDLIGLNPGRRVQCPGYYRLPNSDHRFRDWRSGGHGPTDLHLGIVQSCDVYFYTLAHQLGIDRLQEFMARFGFGRRTGIDIPGEFAGLFPSQEWKERKRKKPWQPGETLIAGIGQGYVQATPVQMARAVAMLANRGRNVEPRVVERFKAPQPVDDPYPRQGEQPLEDLDPRHWRIVANAMIDVVHSARGTAKRIGSGLPYHIAGKTGTAQVFSVAQGKSYKQMHIKKTMRDHAWFVAFAPAEEPRIAVAVIAEHGGHGGAVAAPIARAVIEKYLRRTQ